MSKNIQTKEPTFISFEIPVEVIERDNGVAVVVSNYEEFFYDASEGTFADTEITSEADKKVQKGIWDVIKKDIDHLMKEHLPFFMATHPYGNFKMEITFQEIVL